MYREVIHKGNAYSVSIPEDKFWHTFHVTKHVIESFEEEGFENFLDFSTEEISDSRNKQLNSLHCSIDFNKNKKTFCKICVRMEECFEALTDIHKEYAEHIYDSLDNDQLDPRNATYFDRKIYSRCLLVIDDEGVSIVSSLKDGKYLVRTAFGFNISNANEMSLKFKKLYDDSDWRRDQAIMNWKDKFQNKKRFNDIEKHNSENWRV